MKLTKQDLELFKTLSKSDIGKSLVEYLNRLSDHICDVRSMGTNDTKESVIRASEIIKSHIIGKITKVNDLRNNDTGQFE